MRSTISKALSVVALSLLGLMGPKAAAQGDVELIDYDSVWKFYDLGSEPPGAWQQRVYNDSSWASGPGALGFPSNENLLGLATVQTPMNRHVPGSGNTQQVITFYLRHSFVVGTISEDIVLVASNLVDDGAIFYLNGVEVASFGMPPGDIDYTNTALRGDDVFNHGVDFFEIPGEHLVEGTNVLAVELHQGSQVSNDAIFAMRLLMRSAPARPIPLVPFSHTWRYEDSGMSLGSAWREEDYNDSSWDSGPGPLGFENSALPVPLSTMISSNGMITYYFRTTFDFNRHPPDVDLLFTNMFDDGGIIYLNGVEVLRVGMNPGGVSFGTAAGRTVGNASTENFTIPSDALKVGNNVLAVEMHQVNTTSSDLVMGLSLTAVFPDPTELMILSQPTNTTVEELKTATFSVGILGKGGRYQWFKDGVPITGANRPVLTISNAAPSDAGTYHVIVSNVVNSVTSSGAMLTVIADVFGPTLVLADGTLNQNTVVLTFSERVLASTATNLANYRILTVSTQSLSISSIVLTNNGTAVILTTAAPRNPATNYVVEVNNVRDLAPTSNQIAANSRIPVQTQVIIARFDSDWFFYNPIPPIDEPDLGTAWREQNYPDEATSFGHGPGAFVYDLSNQELPVPRGTALSQGAITSYFRYHFNFLGSPAGATLRLRHAVDDGAIFYLNGKEILRYRLPAQGVNYMTPGSPAVGAATIVETNLPAEVLRYGSNILAVEVHGTAQNDLDIVFGLEVEVLIESLASGPVMITAGPQSREVVEGQPVTLTVQAVGGRTFQWFQNGSPIAGATNSTYTISNASLSLNNNSYRVSVGNPTSSTQNSSNAVLTVIPDTEGPGLVSGFAKANTLTITLDEPVTMASATTLANYTVTNSAGQLKTVTGAVQMSPTTVMLTLSGLAQIGDIVRVSNVRDLSQAGNAICPNSGVSVGFDSLLIPIDAEWKYDASNTDLGTAWRNPSFDDSAWMSGPALLGEEGASLPEPLRTNFLPPNQGGPLTSYFRTRFSFPGTARMTTMQLRYVLDDGAVFYINGLEVHRIGVPAGQNHNTVSSRTVGDAVYEGPVDIVVPSLTAGTNVFAAELHQPNTGSSDAIFGAELLMTGIPSVVMSDCGGGGAAALRIERQGANVVISWDGAGWTLESSDNMPAASWATVATQSPYTVPANAAKKFYRLRR